MKEKKEWLILEAYENKWCATFSESAGETRAEAIKELKSLRDNDPEGDYYLYEAKEI